MDSTHVQAPPPPPQPLSLKLSASKSKLPIKRKIPHSSSPSPHPDPSFRPNPNFPFPGSAPDFFDDPSAAAATDAGSAKPPPFKFHRIWTEPDEIRFLQGLLDSASDGLSFPRDLHVFYDRFSNAMSQPYTKSQLSEKLRRLRKKFRAISSRLIRGLDAAILSAHDRALYDLSRKLWSPEFASISPFGGNSGQGSANSSKAKVEEDAIGVNVGFSLSLPVSDSLNQNERCEPVVINVGDDGKMGKLKVDYDVDLQKEDRPGSGSGYGDGKLGGVAAKTVLDVFDQSLKEAKMALFWQGILCPDHKSSQAVSISSKAGNLVNFGRRWQEQQALELDVFARRLRLVLENSLHEH